MLKTTFVTIAFLFPTLFFAQDYFQQDVDYEINVNLNDGNHTLVGTEILTYTNNSPNSLKEIYFHLWANAYKNKNSAFGKQKLRNNEKDFYFSKAEDRGGYTELSFSTNNNENQWSYDAQHQDIAKVQLTSPLKTGESVKLVIHFTVQIPKPFSRFNRINDSYNVTQWYPKPAVYDHNGWNTMPYLDYGEFYSEFGNFDVTITLPEDYIVAATGTLTTANEIAFLDDLDVQTDSLITYSKAVSLDLDNQKLKTINFQAKNVHDFAWFANKHFLVQKDDFTLANGDPKTAWAFFDEAHLTTWEDAAFFVQRAVKSISDWVGPYPYPQATAIMGETPVGAGMEYPMITNIGPSSKGKELDIVITHEVGHNWFYGILGSNERQYAWMDEGINSFYEQKYTRKYYPKDNKKKKSILGDTSQDEWLVQLDRNENNESNPSHNAIHAGTIQYVNAAYTKPAIVFRHLEAYLGDEKYESIMQVYYETWKFKHPSPKDIQSLFEAKTGKDLDWVFKGFLNSTQKMDYAISEVDEQGDYVDITITNKDGINAPFAIDVIKNDSIINKKWIEGFNGEEVISILVKDYDKISIDSDQLTYDARRPNNTYSKKHKKGKPIKFFPGFSLDHSEQSRINYLPLYGWNIHDKSMFGAAFYNIPMPSKRFNYLLAPMYSFKSNSLNGFAMGKMNSFPKRGFLSKISLGVNAKKFSANANQGTYQKYLKINPFIEFTFRKKATAYVEHSIDLGHNTIFNSIKNDTLSYKEDFKVLKVNYNMNNEHPIFPTRFTASFEHNDVFNASNQKLSAEIIQQWYYTKKSMIDLRLFLGNGFASSTSNVNPSQGFSLYGNSFSDYLYDDLTRYRNSNDQRQNYSIQNRNGGFRSIDGNTETLEMVGKTLFASNITVELPNRFKLIKPYFDYAMVTNSGVSENYWSTGIGVGYKDYINVYFPIASSYDQSDLKYKQKISFSINLTKINPWKIDIKKVLLGMMQ